MSYGDVLDYADALDIPTLSLTNTGWYVNWSKFGENVEVYALVLKGTVDIQGLIALEDVSQSKAVHILWAVTAPQNNVYKYGKKLYSGVGGHHEC